MTVRFFSIGHSNRTGAEFLQLLTESDVRAVVDVRKMPRSRSNPQFGSEVLSATLGQRNIEYEHVADLGGLRSRSSAESPNTYWTNESFRNYADYALTQPFRNGFERLLQIGREQRCAIMCAEAVWWRCHRRIIVDYLIDAGEAVLHILAPGRVEQAEINSAALRVPGGLVYSKGAPTVTPPTDASQDRFG